MFFHTASVLTKIPKIHVYNLKTMDARASGLHFAFSNTFLSLKLALKVVSKSTHNVFSQRWYADQSTQNSRIQFQNSGCQGLRTAFSNTFLSLKAAPWVLPPNQPHQDTPNIFVEVGSKFHSPRPSSLGGVREKPPSGIKRFSFMNMYRSGMYIRSDKIKILIK